MTNLKKQVEKKDKNYYKNQDRKYYKNQNRNQVKPHKSYPPLNWNFSKADRTNSDNIKSDSVKPHKPYPSLNLTSNNIDINNSNSNNFVRDQAETSEEARLVLGKNEWTFGEGFFKKPELKRERLKAKFKRVVNRKKVVVRKAARRLKRLIKVKPFNLVKTKSGKSLKKKYNYESFDDVQFGPKGEKYQYSDFVNQRLLQTQYRRLKRVVHWMVLRPTMSNMFVYVYRLRFNKMKKLRSRKRRRRFMTASLGMLGYKGNAKTSDIALKTLGIYIGRKMKYYGIDCVNLILRSRVSRRYKHFFKGFRESRIAVKYIYVLPKFAHNGCRLKKRRK